MDHLSIYLDVADSATLPYGWSRFAQFSLSVANQIHKKFSIRKGIVSLLVALTVYFVSSLYISLLMSLCLKFA